MPQLRLAAFFCALVIPLCPSAYATDASVGPDSIKLDLAARELRATNTDLAHYSRLPAFEWQQAAAEIKNEIAAADMELAKSIAEALTLEELETEVRYHESAPYQAMLHKTENGIRYSDEEIQAAETFRNSPTNKEVDRKIGAISSRLFAIMEPVTVKLLRRVHELSASPNGRQPIGRFIGKARTTTNRV